MSAVAIHLLDHLRENGVEEALATREDIGEVRKEIAALRAEIRGINRLLIGGFITLFAPIFAGTVALIVKLFFGV